MGPLHDVINQFFSRSQGLVNLCNSSTLHILIIHVEYGEELYIFFHLL